MVKTGHRTAFAFLAQTKNEVVLDRRIIVLNRQPIVRSGVVNPVLHDGDAGRIQSDLRKTLLRDRW